MGFREQVLIDGPVGYWRLNDAAGSANAAAEVGPSAAASGVTFGTAGLNGSLAATFNGAGQLLVNNANTVALGAPTSVTLEALLYVPSFATDHRMFLDWGSNTLNDGISLRVASGTPLQLVCTIALNGSTKRDVTANLPAANAWYHVVAVYDDVADLGYLYVNGALVTTSAAYTGGIGWVAGRLLSIGRPVATPGAFSRHWTGPIDEVVVYGKVLSAARIAAHYTAATVPVADFSAPDPRYGPAPLSIVFTDLTTLAPTAWSWDFGDGSPLSTVQNPTHVYTTDGLFTVTLTATNATGSDNEVKADYIQVLPGAEVEPPAQATIGNTRPPGYIPRKRYPMATTPRQLTAALIAANMDRDQARAIGNVFGKVFEKQATDEYLNYTAIERSMGGLGESYATVTVAASNSLGSADFTCTTGEDNHLVLMEAIAALPASGGRILLLDGSYRFYGNVTMAKDRVWIEGQGWSTQIYAESAFVPFYFPSGSYLEVSSVAFSGSGTSNGISMGGARNSVHDCLFSGGARLNFLSASSRCRAYDNVFDYPFNYGPLNAEGTEHFLYDNDITCQAGNHGILLGSSSSLCVVALNKVKGAFSTSPIVNQGTNNVVAYNFGPSGVLVGSGGVGSYSLATVGNGSATTITITHNLGKTAVDVSVYDNATGLRVLCDVDINTANTLDLIFTTAPALNTYTVVVVG